MEIAAQKRTQYEFLTELLVRRRNHIDATERLIGSIRRECLDHLIIVDAGHLRRVLGRYANYYNNDRTHLGLAKDAPNCRPIETAGELISQPVLGGLHHRYRRK